MHSLAVLATFSSAALFSTNILQAWRILKYRSVLELSFLPLITAYFNCILWLRYGLEVNDSAVILVNLYGVLVSVSVISLYYLYSTEKERVLAEKRLVTLSISIFVIMFCMHKKWLLDAHLLGLIASVASLVMLASPLAGIRNIVRKQESNSHSISLSLPFILSSLTCTLLWSLYGALIVRDYFIVTSNLIGMAVGLFQLYLFLRYRVSSSRTPTPPKFLFPKDHSSYDQIEVMTLPSNI